MVLAVAKNNHPVARAVARIVARRLPGCSGWLLGGVARRLLGCSGWLLGHFMGRPTP